MGVSPPYSALSNSSKTLLEESLSDEGLLTSATARLKRRRCHLNPILCGFLCIFVLNCLFFLYVMRSIPKELGCIHKPREVSPAIEAIRYEPQTFSKELDEPSAFVGKPSRAIDAAWHNLLQYENIVVSEEWLERINRTSIALADGSGYLASLDVFHQLHCVNHLRMYIDSDYYGTHDRPELIQTHVEHCIDTLRKVIMCQGDLSLTTFEWVPHYKRPWPDFNVKHQCRSWNTIMDWAKAHQAQLVGNLVHPELGVLAAEYAGPNGPLFNATEE